MSRKHISALLALLFAANSAAALAETPAVRSAVSTSAAQTVTVSQTAAQTNKATALASAGMPAVTAAPAAATGTTSAKSSASKKFLLKGEVSESLSPIATDGSTNEVPAGTTVSMTMLANVNSEISKVGDDVVAMVSLDVKDQHGGKVFLPGQWCVHGTVTEVAGQRRLGRDGYVTVKFDKLVSPDGKYQVPIDVTASTHESTAKAITKVVAKDSIYVSKGAFAGALTSVQITGIPLAVATHGYSVAAGAAVGATIGLIGALKRKGKITCGLPGEELKFRFDKQVSLPAFNAEALPSAIPVPKVEGLDIVLENHNFMPDPYGDKQSRLLRMSFKMINNTDRAYSFTHLVVVSDHNKMYYPYALSMDSTHQRTKSVDPNGEEEATLTFGVDSPKRKYFLVLLDRRDKEELARVPVN